MEPKVLADALVEAGVLENYEGNDIYTLLGPIGGGHIGVLLYAKADEMITDWRVAGKVLEFHAGFVKIDLDKLSGQWWLCVHGKDPDKPVTMNESLPRAICEAWYEATEQGESDE